MTRSLQVEVQVNNSNGSGWTDTFLWISDDSFPFQTRQHGQHFLPTPWSLFARLPRGQHKRGGESATPPGQREEEEGGHGDSVAWEWTDLCEFREKNS